MQSTIKQAIRRLEEHFSLVCDYSRLQQKERGLGAVYLPLHGNLAYLTKPEIGNRRDGFGSLYASMALSKPKPDWILVVVEVPEFGHKNFSWQLLGIDESGIIRIFHRVWGFQPPNTQTKIFIGKGRTIVERSSPEGIESVSFSVSFSDRGGEV